MEDNRFIITINRECGTGGHDIATQLGKMLGLKVYDRAILDSLAEKFNISVEELEAIKARNTRWWDDFCNFYRQFGGASDHIEQAKRITPKQLYHAEAKILRELAAQESCVIIGRSGFHIFKDDPAAFKIFLIAKEDKRVERMMAKYSIDQTEALRRIKEVDKTRENFTETFAGVSRYDARNYDLVLNVGNLPTEPIAAFLADLVRRRFSLKNAYPQRQIPI